MSETTLSKTETTMLLAAAERGGAFEFPDSTKPSTRERMLGRLLRDGLVVANDAGHVLTPDAYRALGLRPPRAKRNKPAVREEAPGPAPRVTKGTLILQLLERAEGASLAELIEATGWLPHTTRAALSRLRSAGKPLAKSKRQDGTTMYRIEPDEPARRGRKPKADAQAEVAASGEAAA